jgi:WhiB family redox-sensing transcriptional regulator
VLLANVPLDGGAVTSGRLSGDPATDSDTLLALSDLLDGVPGSGLHLPCRTDDADLWFAETPAELERAKQLCGSCPVRDECLAGALRRREPWGVWGGEIFERGNVIARKRPRGRPSKAALERDRELVASR